MAESSALKADLFKTKAKSVRPLLQDLFLPLQGLMGC